MSQDDEFGSEGSSFGRVVGRDRKLESSLNRHQSQSLGVCIREFEDTGHQRQLLAEKNWTEAGGRGVGLGYFSGDEANPFIADE